VGTKCQGTIGGDHLTRKKTSRIIPREGTTRKGRREQTGGGQNKNKAGPQKKRHPTIPAKGSEPELCRKKNQKTHGGGRSRISTKRA